MEYYNFPTFLFNRKRNTESVIVIGKNETQTEYDYNSIVFRDSRSTIKITEADEKESIVTLKTIMTNINILTDEMLFSYYFFSLIQISMFSIESIDKEMRKILSNKDEQIQKYFKLLEIDENFADKLKKSCNHVYSNEHLQNIFNLAKILYIIEKSKNTKKEIVELQLKLK